MSDEVVLYHDCDKVRVGGVFRYDVYLDSDRFERDLFVRVRNTELAALRAAYLNGPFTLYVDMMPMDYSEFATASGGIEPKYENHLKAGSHFKTELRVRHPRQRWRITISSEILFSRTAEVNFEITIATSEYASMLTGSKAEKHIGADPLAKEFQVSKFDTASIWQVPLPKENFPLHICVLTHGLVSNVTADMLYLKEKLDQAADVSGENLICKGYTGNVCRTERGVKYLGRRLAIWLVNELIPTYKPAKLSFVAHSLGGLIQAYALGYIEATQPEALHGIELVNFIALASPFLGISNENPGYVQFALNFGVVGKTGRDLGLAWAPGESTPLLERIPGDSTQKILRRFRCRTVYANAVHDGIVPLRTASLLYLDWRALGQASAVEKDDETSRHSIHGRGRKNSIAEENFDHKRARVLQEAAKENENKNSQIKAKPSSSSSKHSAGPSSVASSLDSMDFPLASFLFGNRKQEKILSRYQTVGENDNLSLVSEKLPRKTSLIESGMSLLLPPHPGSEFIENPQSRDDVIFHDRIYHHEELPARRFKKRLSFINGYKEKVDVAKSEERIARSYHNGTSWRKVLVTLQPEAHNNIIVRRRFSNAYGWPVVHHLVRIHFLFPVSRDAADYSQDLASKAADLKLQPEEEDEEQQIEDPSGESPSSENARSEDLKASRASQSSPWSESDDWDDSGPDKDFDPHRASMFRIVPTNIKNR